jgi:hypothetical protein
MNKHEAATPEISRAGQRDGQGKTHRDRSVYGIAAGCQDIGARL